MKEAQKVLDIFFFEFHSFCNAGQSLESINEYLMRTSIYFLITSQIQPLYSSLAKNRDKFLIFLKKIPCETYYLINFHPPYSMLIYF